MLARRVQGSKIVAVMGEPPTSSMEEIMSSTASLITLLASVAFGLVVFAVMARLGPRTPS